MSHDPPVDATVSVVVPFHQAGRYLDETLRSIEAQTRPADQVVLVDDGSTDDGPAVAAAHAAAAGPATVVVTQAHRGIGAARNAGLAAATGSLVAFCDADDLWAPTKLALQLDLLAGRPELGAVWCGVEEFVSPELTPDQAAGLRPARRIDAAVATSALLVRRPVVEAVGPFDEELRIGDWFDWYARLRQSGCTVAAVDEVLVRRRLHTTNNSLRQRQARHEYAQVLHAHLRRTRGDQDEPEATP